MPITQIGRQIRSVSVSTTYSLTDYDIEQVVADATSAGFTITIYNDTNSGAYHRLVIKVSDDDTSGNTVTIVDAIGNFSTTLASTSAAVELETDPTGNWIAVAAFPTLDANTAISAADSAGLRSSTAESTAVSGTSTAVSAATSNSLNISTTGSVAASAVLSGVSGTASVATSQNASQSLNLSSTGSTATSQNASQSLNVSTAQSTAAS